LRDTDVHYHVHNIPPPKHRGPLRITIRSYSGGIIYRIWSEEHLRHWDLILLLRKIQF